MNMLLAFAPFAVFALLTRPLGVQCGLILATLLCAALIVRDRWMKKRSLKFLEVGSLLLFGGLALLVRYTQFNFTIVQVRLIVDLGLLVIVLVSILFRRPFTAQYAMEQVSAEVAATDRFKRTSFQLSAVWALAFAMIVVADMAMLYVPVFKPAAGAAAIVAVLAAALWFSQWLPRRR